MSKNPFHFLAALILFPTLYHIVSFVRLGYVLQYSGVVTYRLLGISVIILISLWFYKGNSLGRLCLYMINMLLGSFFAIVLINLPFKHTGIEPTQMLRVLVYASPNYFISVFIVASLLWIVRDPSSIAKIEIPRELGNRREL